MRKGAFLMVAVWLGFAWQPAAAADWYTGSTAAPAESRENWIVDVDMSVSVASKDTTFLGVSATFAAVDSLRTSGWRGRVEGLFGRYGYEQATTNATIRSQQEGGGLMAGYEWVSRDTTVSLWAGFDVKHTSLSQPDPENSVVGTGVGAKFAAQFHTMLARDVMASAYASYSTLHNAYYARGKAGWAVVDGVFIGPEVSVLGDDFYRQYRVGAHVTGLRLGALRIGVSGGYLYDPRQGDGTYAIIDARLGF